ncbi:hypothetical protein RHSIM_RhsimUnG0020600 [Rhododendron simsii]|uniref:Aladin n=1 Tax=Rhododendron simsii TaxID=118357 RepID=A0A834FW61_RHOSS|nr:hypothetical protein RHSIM_RhsimUnG0020600 [Rhododendron simsii]
MHKTAVTAAEPLADDQAKETYAKILGTVFSPVSFQTDHLISSPSPEQGSEQRGRIEESDQRNSWSTALREIFSDSLKRLFHQVDVSVDLPCTEGWRKDPTHSRASLPSLLALQVKSLPEVDLHGVSWHQHKHILAFISGPNHVTIRDYEDSEGKEPFILTHESQRDVKLLEWRPNGGRTLSVACKGGICIWTASNPGNIASVRSGVASGTLSRGSGARWTLVDFLRSHDDEQIRCGDFRVCMANKETYTKKLEERVETDDNGKPKMTMGEGVEGEDFSRSSGDEKEALRKKIDSLVCVCRLQKGAFASDGTFYLWETNTWTSEPWSSSSGFVTGVTWDPDGRMILIAFSDSSTLGSIHFASNPPSLDAHLLPVDLPEVKSLTHSRGIEKIAWDGSGERLAISYKDGDDLYKGLIAVYDVRRSKLISASLIVGAADFAAPTLLYFGRMFCPNPAFLALEGKKPHFVRIFQHSFGLYDIFFKVENAVWARVGLGVALLEWVKEYPMVFTIRTSRRRPLEVKYFRRLGSLCFLTEAFCARTVEEILFALTYMKFWISVLLHFLHSIFNICIYAFPGS